MSPSTQKKPLRNPDLIWRDADDGMVIVSPTAGKVRVLNQVGTSIWSMLDGKHTIDEIEESLQQTFASVPNQQLKQDLHNFINDLSARGLLSWKENQA